MTWPREALASERAASQWSVRWSENERGRVSQAKKERVFHRHNFYFISFKTPAKTSALTVVLAGHPTHCQKELATLRTHGYITGISHVPKSSHPPPIRAPQERFPSGDPFGVLTEEYRPSPSWPIACFYACYQAYARRRPDAQRSAVQRPADCTERVRQVPPLSLFFSLLPVITSGSPKPPEEAPSTPGRPGSDLIGPR
jgi:hypothetical protein